MSLTNADWDWAKWFANKRPSSLLWPRRREMVLLKAPEERSCEGRGET
jgi:hypothetical protein